MKAEISSVTLPKEETSNILMEWAASIDLCESALWTVIENSVTNPSEHAIATLIAEKLSLVKKSINQFDTQKL